MVVPLELFYLIYSGIVHAKFVSLEQFSESFVSLMFSVGQVNLTIGIYFEMVFQFFLKSIF